MTTEGVVFLSIAELFFPENYNYFKFSNSLTRLIANVGLGTIQALNAKQYRAFDANPGDSGCQNRAFALREIFQRDLGQECENLEPKMRTVPQKVTKEQLRDENFFNMYFNTVRLSPDMAYLMLCYFLTFLKKVQTTSEQGVLRTKSEIDRMRFLHPR